MAVSTMSVEQTSDLVAPDGNVDLRLMFIVTWYVPVVGEVDASGVPRPTG
jgi:hypothetical protein